MPLARQVQRLSRCSSWTTRFDVEILTREPQCLHISKGPGVNRLNSRQLILVRLPEVSDGAMAAVGANLFTSFTHQLGLIYSV